MSTIANDYDEDDNKSKIENGSSVNISDREVLPPPPPLPPGINHLDLSTKQEEPPVARTDDDDIFVGEGVDYTVPGKDVTQSPISEDMEESPRDKEKVSYFDEPAYGPVQEKVPYFAEPAYGPVQPSAGQEWQDMVSSP
jgi:IK cytokine